MKIGTVNIQGGYNGKNAKRELVVKECSKFGLDILAICDVQVRGRIDEMVGEEGHRVLISGIQRGGPTKWGVGMVLGSEMEKRLLEVSYVNERIMWARFSMKDMICRVIVVYALV